MGTMKYQLTLPRSRGGQKQVTCDCHNCTEKATHKHYYAIYRNSDGAKGTRDRRSIQVCKKHFDYLERAERSWAKLRDGMGRTYCLGDVASASRPLKDVFTVGCGRSAKKTLS